MAHYRGGQEGKRCGGAFFITTKEGLRALKKNLPAHPNHCQLRAQKNGGSMNDWCDLLDCPARELLYIQSQKEQRQRLREFRAVTARKVATEKKYVTGRKTISLKKLLTHVNERIIWS